MGIALISVQALAGDFTITDLGSLGGLINGSTYSQATAINNTGEIVGVSYVPTGSNPHAFVYRNGVMTDLTPNAVGYTNALGTNDNGVIVGQGSNSQPYIYADGTFNYLGFRGSATAINNSNVVVGTNFDNHQAFVYSNGSINYLGTLGGMASDGFGISSNGLVVGDSFTTGNATIDAFIFKNGQLQNLGIPYADQQMSVYASAVNDAGQVVGRNGNEAFLYQNGLTIDIGATYFSGQFSWAKDVNAKGQVVGWHVDTANHGLANAFLFENGTMQDLSVVFDANGWTDVQANAINDNGQIVGLGTINGQQHAFLATPVPVPGGMLLFGSALLGLVSIACRKAAA